MSTKTITNNQTVKATSAGSTSSQKKSKMNNQNENRKSNLVSIFSLLAFILFFSIVIIIIFSARSCSNDNVIYTNPYSSVTKVNYETEYLGTIKRNIPTEVKDEGLSSVGYPKYGYTLKECIGTSEEQIALRNAIIAESSYLTATTTRNAGGGGYNRMDAKGYLYLDDNPALDKDGNQRYLYKHTASQGLYLGDVSDDEPGIIKRVTLQPRGYDSYSVTGVYAPAGEVITIEISAEDMEATGGIIVHIGQALYNRKANNIWTEKNVMNRMPHLLNTMVVTKDTATFDENRGTYIAYVGSFLGGPVYIQNESVEFSVTISGAVRYSHFILGYTTVEEFTENAKSSAPIFDLEVWEYGVLHSGPRVYANSFSYDDLYDAAILWEKISLVSTQITKQGIVFLYDPFVAAGAAVAFPGQYSVNCPMDWMASALNYNSFVNSGAWGNMHEYNHNFQGWGLGNGGEVTNNSLNLVSYSLFTKISSSREIGTMNEGLSAWNCYTNASWVLRDITEGRYSNGTMGLSIYATLLHNFGQDVFLNAAKTSGGQSIDKYFTSTMNSSSYDMTYFFKDLLGYSVSSETLASAASKNYPMFVPVASIFQTGRSFNYYGEKEYTHTMQPYVIAYGEEFTFDLNPCVFDSGNIYQQGSIVIPEGFSYTIKNISQPQNGTIRSEGNNIYTFIPNSSYLSGEIIVTLEITKDDGAFEVEDVDLVLEFEQSHEMNKTMLERTIYTFSAENMYDSAVSAFEAKYANYLTKVEEDNQNPILNGKVVQNGNAEIWYTLAEQMEDNQIVELKGKMYIDETGKYRIALRGRYDCALYVSFDNGETYVLAGKYLQTNTSSPDFPVDSEGNPLEGTYSDYELSAGTWLYFKAVLVTQNTGKFGFIGVGWGKFTPGVPIFDENDNPIGETPETVKISYASALRESYEFPVSTFTSDYYYKRDYLYNYTYNNSIDSEYPMITAENYTPYNATRDKVEYLMDGNYGTYIHTNGALNPDKPLTFLCDLGVNITAKEFILSTQNRPNGDWYYPTAFQLEVSMDGENFIDLGTFDDLKWSSLSTIVSFEDITLRYFRLTILKSTGTYVILTEAAFRYVGHQISLDEDSVVLRGNWQPISTMSTFGHIFKGKKNAKIEFEFEGTRFGICSTLSTHEDFEVYIDGKKIDSIDILENSDLGYLSDLLTYGKHKVTIQCSKDTYIDSLVYWN